MLFNFVKLKIAHFRNGGVKKPKTLIYNDPADYANLVLNGDPEKYLKVVTTYHLPE